MTVTESINLAKQLEQKMLPSGELPKEEVIRGKVSMVITMLRSENKDLEIDEEKLVREIRAACYVWIPNATSLEDNNDHFEWLSDRRGDIQWKFWERYERYLEEVEQFPPESIRRLDEISEDILKRLEDP